VEEVLGAVRLLTRHKRDCYYQSIIEIFVGDDEKMRERAIPVKLSDRIHNILCIESFNEQQRMFQCFKNLFILNNVKNILWNERVNILNKQKNCLKNVERLLTMLF